MQLLVTHMAVADHLPPNLPLWGKVSGLNLFYNLWLLQDWLEQDSVADV